MRHSTWLETPELLPSTDRNSGTFTGPTTMITMLVEEGLRKVTLGCCSMD